jgi:hypothetical protein
VDGVAGFGCGAVQEHVEAFGVAMDKTGLGQSRGGPWQVRPAQENINALRVARRRLIHAGDPRGHGIAAYHRVGHIRCVQSGHSAPQPFTNFFHGSDHPFPGNLGQTRRPTRRLAGGPGGWSVERGSVECRA